jgi:transposase
VGGIESSGETQCRGRITKAGAGRVQWLLIQVTLSMVRLRDPRTAELRDTSPRGQASHGQPAQANCGAQVVTP